GQVGTSSLLSLAHGSNDAQKTMGVIALALVAAHPGEQFHVPVWVIASAAASMGLGTYAGGWRIIRTMGHGLVEVDSPQGFAAEASSAATILLSTHFGYSLSTTHVVTGSILGTGLGRSGALVRWQVARRMVVAWLVTLPTAGLVGVGAYALASSLGDDVGVLVDFVVLALALVGLYARSRRAPVTALNVNDEWDEPPTKDSEPRHRVPLAA
ncbi:MAG: inorganic phosphate transporter, partial [Mycobacteriales bacterium]